MTDAAALSEAMRRWGIVGAIWHRLAYYVGVYNLDKKGTVKSVRMFGSGNSWEEAFADADRNAKE